MKKTLLSMETIIKIRHAIPIAATAVTMTTITMTTTRSRRLILATRSRSIYQFLQTSTSVIIIIVAFNIIIVVVFALCWVCQPQVECLNAEHVIHSGYFSPLQVHYYSEALPTQHGYILCRSFAPKRHRQLWVKDLSKVTTWRLERDLNPRPAGRQL